MATTERNQAIDIIRVISILGVVMIHTSTRILEASHFDLARYPVTVFLNQSARFAVPMFFMISGFVLELSHKDNSSYFTYIKKRVSRIFIPYVFWSAIYYILVYRQHTISFLQSLLTGNSSYQLYFIPTLLIFYAVFPLIHKLYPLLYKKVVFLGLGGLQIWLLYYSYQIRPLPVAYPLAIALLNFYVFLIGIWASHYTERFLKLAQRFKFILAGTTVVLAIIVFEEGFKGYLETHNYLKFYTQWRPSVMGYTLSLGGGLYYLFSQKKYQLIIFRTLSQLSFFVFFVHVIMLELIWSITGKQLFEQTQNRIGQDVWFTLLFFGLVGAAAFTFAYIIHKVPRLDKITG